MGINTTAPQYNQSVLLLCIGVQDRLASLNMQHNFLVPDPTRDLDWGGFRGGELARLALLLNDFLN